jgi:hypothetical protein
MAPTAKRGARSGQVYVGITGHRPNRMPERHWDRVKRDLAAAMADIEAAYPGRQITLLSGIAEGADRLAAFVALGRGWKLHSILAFHRARFEEDFPTAFARGEFRALLEASDRVYEPTRDAHLKQPAEEGYHAVGQRLLELLEVLIAVWDGRSSRGKGGTVDVLEEARDKGKPVVWVHATKSQPVRNLQPRDTSPRSSPTPSASVPRRGSSRTRCTAATS